MSACRGCGAEMVWAVSETGARIPLDPRVQVYIVTEERDENGYEVTKARRAGQEGARLMVSHFQTCPKANNFSRAKRDRDLFTGSGA